MGKFAGFQSVQLKKPQRSSFDLSHDKRLTTRMGKLTPIVVQECVPSDSFRGSSEVLVRLAPLLAPIYDQINVFVHYFFVPNRLLWEDWEEFITGGRLGVGTDPVVAPIPPNFDVGAVVGVNVDIFDKGSLSDYMGLPLTGGPSSATWAGILIDAMPFIAYQLVWYEYYRDRNFIDDTPNLYPYASGTMGVGLAEDIIEIKTRNYLHDYFTSALPFTQRGEEVLMPVELGGNAPLYLTSLLGAATTGSTISALESPGAIAVGYGLGGIAPDASLGNGKLYVRGEDFDGTSTSINDFRSAYALQVWLERNAIGGSRYTESTQAHFGVKPQDSRLQRPEYIGGGMVPVRISEVVATAWSNDGTGEVPQANMAGHGISYGNTNQFNYFCVEHGFIIGIMSIMNPPSYQQGLHRMFRRRSFLDYPWPTFAKLGEQEVHNYELYTTAASLTEDADGNLPLFGYQSRYADWKYQCNSNHGDFRDTLLFWTLTRTFSSTPVLSAEFNEFDDATQDRIFAVPDVDNFWIYIHNKIHVKRPLPYFGTPNTLGFGS